MEYTEQEINLIQSASKNYWEQEETFLKDSFNEAFYSSAMQTIINNRIMQAIILARKGYDEFGENGFINHGFDFTEKQILLQLNK